MHLFSLYRSCLILAGTYITCLQNSTHLSHPGANYVFLSLNMCENAFTQILLLSFLFFMFYN